jgi:hypothetical protein|tara:strand:+ start:183 stop:620 length:438 start_codon:yes stop_codon:yes gene_type:complete
MKLTEIFQHLEERKTGDSPGRKDYTSGGEKKEKKKAFKGRVKTYDSIKAALSAGSYGQIFSTKAAGRLYVISKGKWGSKSGKGKIAKGFTPGSSTPSSDFASVRKHAARTLLRYGKGSDKLAAKYGSRSIRKERGIGGKDGRKDT